jgi:hypothetical protein
MTSMCDAHGCSAWPQSRLAAETTAPPEACSNAPLSPVLASPMLGRRVSYAS